MPANNLSNNSLAPVAMEIILDPRIVGSVYIVTAVILMSLYVIALYAIRCDREVYQSSCYRLMFWLGAFEVLLPVFSGILPGIMTISGSVFNAVFCKVAGALSQLIWFYLVSMTSILTFNRFLIVWFSPSSSMLLFSPTKTRLWILACFSFACIELLIYLLPDFDMLYYPSYNAWLYGPQTPAGLITYATVVSCSAVVFILILNTMIIVKLNRVRSIAKNSSQVGAFMYQAFAAPMATGFALSFEVLYFFVAPKFSLNAVMIFSLQYIGLVSTGFNGMLYLLFNQTVRKNAWKLLMPTWFQKKLHTAVSASCSNKNCQSSKKNEPSPKFGDQSPKSPKSVSSGARPMTSYLGSGIVLNVVVPDS